MPTLEHFLACRRQFRTGGMGGVIGLQAESVKAVLEMRGVEPADLMRLWGDLDDMGAAAAEVINRKPNA